MGCFAETSGEGLGKGKDLTRSRLHVSKYQGVGLVGGVVVSCMNPARRASKGFIWSVRLSEAEHSKNRRFLAPQQPFKGGESGDRLGALLASEIGWCQQGHSERRIITNLIQKGTNAETS